MMDVHAGRLFIASADHTKELPSISFVEPGMIGQKIQRVDSHRRHVIADILEKKACDPLVKESQNINDNQAYTCTIICFPSSQKQLFL